MWADAEDTWHTGDTSGDSVVPAHLIGNDLGINRGTLAPCQAVDLAPAVLDEVVRALGGDVLDSEFCEALAVDLDQLAHRCGDATNDVGLSLCVEGICLRLVERVVDGRLDVGELVDHRHQEGELVLEHSLLDRHTTADIDDRVGHRHPPHVAEALDVGVSPLPKQPSRTTEELAQTSVEGTEGHDADPVVLECECDESAECEIEEIPPSHVEDRLKVEHRHCSLCRWYCL